MITLRLDPPVTPTVETSGQQTFQDWFPLEIVLLQDIRAVLFIKVDKCTLRKFNCTTSWSKFRNSLCFRSRTWWKNGSCKVLAPFTIYYNTSSGSLLNSSYPAPYNNLGVPGALTYDVLFATKFNNLCISIICKYTKSIF